MTIQQCKYVVEISKVGSFNEASKNLFVAQSSLSSSIKTLEKELGIEIFIRTRNGVCLTEAGAEFLRYAEQMIEHSNFIECRYNDNKSIKRLNIVTQHYDFIADIFCELIRETESENFHFSIREIKTYDIIKELESSSSDIGVIAIKNTDLDLMNRFLSSKNLEFVSLLKVMPHVFIRNDHPLCKSKKIVKDELERYPYVSYEQGSHSATFFTEEISNKSQAKKHVEISDRATLMNVLLTTNCYTIGTGIMPSALNDGKIIAIPYVTEKFYYLGYIINKAIKKTEIAQAFTTKLTNFTNKETLKGLI